MTVSVIMYKRLGVSNAEIAAYTSLLYLPWVIKPIWSPLVEGFRTRRGWILAMQIAVGVGLAAVAVSIQSAAFLVMTLAFFTVVAFSSATHDVAADGFYMLALSPHDQAWFVGIRSTFYRLAMIAGQGALVVLAGFLETNTGLPEAVVAVRAADSELVAPVFDVDRPLAAETSDDQAILVLDEQIELSTSVRSPEEVSQLVASVRDWNVRNGFYSVEEPQSQQAAAEEQSWLESIETFVRWLFRVDEVAQAGKQESGDVAVVLMRLVRPLEADESLVVLFDRRSGDKSFSVVEGGRFELNQENSSKPFAAVVEVDPKLNAPSAASFSARSGNFPLAWSATLAMLAGFFVLISFYHWWALPRPGTDVSGGARDGIGLVQRFLRPFGTFFKKDRVLTMLAFLLLYRFAEAQLAKLAAPFLLDSREAGGLALSTGQVGVVYGTVGVLMLTLGGILGGFAAARHGLKKWIWWMVIAINLPNVVYLLLARSQPESLWVVNVAVGVEQFGYGFGFAAYMLYMLYISQGESETVHFALCTGFMALGMMVPGFFCGWLEQVVGYERFFFWVMLSTLPSFLVTWLIPLDEGFGRKSPTDQ